MDWQQADDLIYHIIVFTNKTITSKVTHTAQTGLYSTALIKGPGPEQNSVNGQANQS